MRTDNERSSNCPKAPTNNYLRDEPTCRQLFSDSTPRGFGSEAAFAESVSDQSAERSFASGVACHTAPEQGVVV
jgi:hypothetical protein